ncbi:prolyl-tRNA synthetase associated domain-containing protein [Roseovarius sp. EL26]|uniref:prolyl-tRNA synthetase associated domain-containing protein n=1 Tax=Roseovarius sp. EL26 TaxID=2126672 RepID=UPI000EA110F8|nr:prolyl-tRNA synthetase associated domain-containing protein [Roseovarius sp. EL26]
MDASSTYQDTLPVSSDALLETLRGWGIALEYYEHTPLRTVEDAKSLQGSVIPAGTGRVDIKNLYMRDKKKRNYLIVLEQDRTIDLKELGTAIGAGNVSFGSADRLLEHLGVRPGAVSPLTMVTGAQTGVQIYLDPALREAELIHAHPLVNDRTVAMTPDDLLAVLERWGAKVNWLDF